MRGRGCGGDSESEACATRIPVVLNRVLGIQYLDPWPGRACTLFLLLRRLSSEETMSTRLTHDLGCNWTDEFPRCLL